jgi:serine/threonine protein kinase
LRDLIPPIDYKHFDDVYLVMDLMEKDLRSVLKTTQKFDPKTVKYFAYQLLKGIKVIHSADVVHRDIKPSNILLNRRLEICYCDFGLAREIETGMEGPTMSTPYVVTRWYRAPELLMMYEKAGRAFDIWSIGCIFFELLQDYPRVAVFQGKNHLHQLDLILDVLGTPDESDIKACKSAHEYVQSLAYKPKTKLIHHPLMPSDVDHDAVDLLQQLLMFNPDKRISAIDALAHPYFEEFHNLEDEPVTQKYHGGDEKIADDKEILRKALYDDIMLWNKEINDLSGDAEIETEILSPPLKENK